MTQFYSNLSFFKKQLHESQLVYCEYIKISSSAYDTYRKGKLPGGKTLQLITAQLNELIPKHPDLAARFPNGITENQMSYTDLSKVAPLGEPHRHYDKFGGTYLCYYMSTDIQRGPQIHYGVIQIRGDESLQPTECNCKGVFSISNYDYALELFNDVKTQGDFSEIPSATIFNGKAFISPSVLWITMYDDAHLEHVAMSFDFDEKVLTRHSKEEKDFIGARGIALSQSHGQGSQSVSFPIIISKHQLQSSENETKHYLNFSYSKVNEAALLRAAKNVANLHASITENNNLHLTDTTDLLVSLIQFEVKRLLSQHVFNSHYYLFEEQSEFYHNILKLKKDN